MKANLVCETELLQTEQIKTKAPTITPPFPNAFKALRATEIYTNAQVLIDELLKQPGFNLTRIALEIDISKASVSRIKKGQIKNTNGKTFRKLLMLYCKVCA